MTLFCTCPHIALLIKLMLYHAAACRGAHMYILALLYLGQLADKQCRRA